MKPEEAIADRQSLNPVRVGVYLRVSTGRQAAEERPVQAQKEFVTRYAERSLGATVRAESVTCYADVGRSGMDADGLELKRLLADVRAGQLDFVVACSATRISRSRSGFDSDEALLRAHGVQLRFVNDLPHAAVAGSE